MLYLEKGSDKISISSAELKSLVNKTLDLLGDRQKVLVIPPDITRFHSRAGEITKIIYHYYGEQLINILPALGTHSAMTDTELETMFPGVPKELFLVHDWRNDTEIIGNVPSEFIKQVSENTVNYDWPVEVNKILVSGEYDLIISVGQVVPHEVIGMANYNKNIFVGTGGKQSVNLSHYLGACYGMEKIMGKALNPVRSVLNYASDNFLNNLPVVYFLTVIGNIQNEPDQLCGLFVGDNVDSFLKAADLSEKVNIQILEEKLNKVIVYLDPSEYKSTWLGNKSIYRTRMAMADDGELIILAPGIKTFGEDKEIDRLIRKYGYIGTETIIKAVNSNNDLKDNLSAAAHLIHGSSESRFRVKYCTGKLGQAEVESVGFEYADLEKMMIKYKPEMLKEGYNVIPDGEQIYYISNPALGLWMYNSIMKNY